MSEHEAAKAMREAAAQLARSYASTKESPYSTAFYELENDIRALPLPNSTPDPTKALKLARKALRHYQKLGFHYGDAALAAIDAIKGGA